MPRRLEGGLPCQVVKSADAALPKAWSGGPARWIRAGATVPFQTRVNSGGEAHHPVALVL